MPKIREDDFRRPSLSTTAELRKEEQIVVFRLDAESYAIDIFRVNEIIRMRDITPIPHTEAHIRGLVNLRGKTIPVVDLRVRFGLTITEATEKTRIIVVESKDGLVGIIVDEVSEVITLAAENVEDTPGLVSSVGTDFVSGVAKSSGKLITLLELDRALAG
jgi:purine-binding chemotaxis protein CheW